MSRAHDRELGRDVAIKELISRSSVDEVRFLREALITARLEHPGIVPVHEAGRWPDGTPFYAMKLVSGRSLRDLIAERPVGEARLGLLHHVIAVADAIAYAHGRNIIHRDLKPGNVIVGDFGETIVIDWGLAKDIATPEESNSSQQRPAQADEELTAVGSVLGTPAYMAPEQKRGEHVDQRADVFAIGAMLWELCSPRRTLPASPVQRHRMLRRAGIDKDLIAIIDKALDPDPGLRYADAGELAADLKAFKSGARIAARSYSLYAMLAHWTRRHRAIALSVIAALVLSAAGIVVYVRNIKTERDRADSALLSAQRERDRAKLSEASLLIENDPNRAKDLLASLTLHSPQYALLTGRMSQLSASRVVPTSSLVDGVYRVPGAATLDVVTRDGGFHRLDPLHATLETIDHDLTGAIAYRGGQWLYARRTYGAGSVRIASPVQSNMFDIDLRNVLRLVGVNDAVYALETGGDVHRLDGTAAGVIERGVRNIVGHGDTRMRCDKNGDLTVLRKAEVVYRGTCTDNNSPYTMAVVGDDFATLTASRTLLASRRGKLVEITTPIRNEYELSMSSDGLIAIAEYGPTGNAWFVRPGSTLLETGPTRNAELLSLAVDGSLAAWGYFDGMVSVLDTATGTAWPLRGHPGGVSSIVVDAANARVAAGGKREVRVWDLRPPAASLVTPMPCRTRNILASPDPRYVALDCNDGVVRLWSRDTGTIARVHAHVGQATGVAWLHGAICSGGFLDGRVICSRPDGSELQTLESGTSRIISLVSSPARDFVVYSSSDGKVWRYAGEQPQVLYTQNLAVRLAVSDDGRRVASCAVDGSLAVYDVVQRRLIAQQRAHTGSANGVAWVGGELWTAGDDGAIQRWSVLDTGLTLRHTLKLPAAMQTLHVAHGNWAGNGGDSILMIGRSGSSLALHVDLGRPIDALAMSADGRYVAAGGNGEIVVVDLQRDAIATMTVGSPKPQGLSFVEPTSLAFSEIGTLKSVAVDQLEYVPFQAATEP